MNWTALPALVALLAAAGPLAAQDAAEPVSVTIDGVLVKPDELPTTIKPVKGMPCASRQPRSYYETPDPEKLTGDQPVPAARKSIPKPKAKRCQAFIADGGVAGSVFVFEYSEEDVESARAFFPAYLWRGRRSTKQRPEELIVHGNLVWILSFPRGDPAAEWYKARLRKKFRVPALRERPELRPLLKQVLEAYGDKDTDKGLRILEENAELAGDWALGHYFIGEFAVRKQDWPTAERAYRRALELHETLVDPLNGVLLWASLDGLGMALLFQRKLNDAATVLAAAKGLGAAHGPHEAAKSAYNLACAHALLQRWPDALAALEEAIAGNPKYRASARTDEDLAEARKRKEFQELLKEPPEAPEAPQEE